MPIHIIIVVIEASYIDGLLGPDKTVSLPNIGPSHLNESTLPVHELDQLENTPYFHRSICLLLSIYHIINWKFGRDVKVEDSFIEAST